MPARRRARHVRRTYKQDEFNLLPGGFLYGLSYIGVEEASWDGNPTPNSRSMMLVPSIGGIWPIDKGSFSLSIQKPFFVKGRSIMVGIEDISDDPLNNKTNVFLTAIECERTPALIAGIITVSNNCMLPPNTPVGDGL